MDTTTIAPTLVSKRYFTDFTWLNQNLAYFRSVATIKMDFSSINQNAVAYSVAVRMHLDSDNSFAGTLVLIYDEATNEIAKSMILEADIAPPESRSSIMINQHPVLSNSLLLFEWAVNYRTTTAPM